MAREDHCCTDDGEKATCVHYVCVWASNRKRQKGGFREALDRMVGLMEAHVLMCITGHFNGHVGTA